MFTAAIVVISSKIKNGEKPDSGRVPLEQYLHQHDGRIVAYEVVHDDRLEIRECLRGMVETHSPQVILTMGGTGVRPTDWAPEATRDVIDKEIPGIGETMRSESVKKVRTAMLSRGTAGLLGETLIVNLPGNPKGAQDNLGVLLPILEHTIEKIAGPMLSNA